MPLVSWYHSHFPDIVERVSLHNIFDCICSANTMFNFLFRSNFHTWLALAVLVFAHHQGGSFSSSGILNVAHNHYSQTSRFSSNHFSSVCPPASDLSHCCGPLPQRFYQEARFRLSYIDTSRRIVCDSIFNSI